MAIETVTCPLTFVGFVIGPSHSPTIKAAVLTRPGTPRTRLAVDRLFSARSANRSAASRAAQLALQITHDVRAGSFLCHNGIARNTVDARSTRESRTGDVERAITSITTR